MTSDEITELATTIAEARRKAVRPLLPQITVDLEREMGICGLHFPVSIALSNDPTAIVTLATPDDTQAAEFERACDILCAIVARHLGVGTIAHREPTSTPVAGEITSTAD